MATKGEARSYIYLAGSLSPKFELSQRREGSDS